MSTPGIRFVRLPEPLQERLTKVMRKVESGEVDPDWGSQLFLRYFAQRLGIIVNNSSKRDFLNQIAKGMRLALLIKGTNINHTATFGDTVTQITIARGSKFSDPAMIFNNMDIFLDVILSRQDFLRASIEKKVEVRKAATLFKWMGPITAMQDDRTQAILEEKCPPILDQIIAEIESKVKI
jgi:hypothetical protein